MQDTTTTATMIMHDQDRNVHGKVFGGLLMRHAFELGYIATRQFSGDSEPAFSNCDQVSFLQPVQIGAIVKLQATVVFAEGKRVRVRVEAQDLKTKTGPTNEFHFTFTLQREAPNVVPRTYEEGLYFLEGQRAVRKAT